MTHYSLMTKIRDDTWNVLDMQHITLCLKIWDYSDILGGATWKSIGRAHTVEKDPNPHSQQ